MFLISIWHNTKVFSFNLGFPCGSAGKKSTSNVRDLGSSPGLGRSLGEGKGHLLQFSGLENSMDCIVHGFAKSQVRLSNFYFTSLLHLTHKILKLKDLLSITKFALTFENYVELPILYLYIMDSKVRWLLSLISSFSFLSNSL